MKSLTNFPVIHRQRFTILAICLSLVAGVRANAEEPKKPADPFARWEKEIAALEASAAKGTLPSEGIVLVGSSSIRRWDVAKSFPDLPVVNRGFGGSQLADSVHFAPRIVLPLKPKIVVLYAGDNDLASGKSPEKVVADYREFVDVIRQALPETRIVYIAVKPSIKRWNLIEKVRATNQQIQAITKQDDKQSFVDIDTPMLGENGEPRPELFVSDGLHLTDAGYALWARLLLPHLQEE